MDGNLVADKSDISKGNWEKVDNPMNNIDNCITISQKGNQTYTSLQVLMDQ